MFDFSLTDVVSRLGWTLLHSVWQFSLIGMLVAIAIKLASRRSANLRYLISCCGLALMFVALVITFGFVSHQIEPLFDGPPQLATQEMEFDLTTEPRQIESSVGASTFELPSPQFKAAKGWGGSNPTIWESLQMATNPWLPWLVGSWSLGVAALSVWNVGGWLVVLRLRRLGISPLDDSLQHRFEMLANRLRVSRPVTLTASLLVDVPIVIGWLRPVVLLPASLLSGIPSSQLEAILAHELAHIRRHDYLVNLVQLFTEALFFYHPAVWLISRQIRILREYCCDDLAIAVVRDRSTYVKALASVETNRLSPACAVAMSGGGQALSLQRARRILRLHQTTATSSVLSICAVALATTTGICAVACIAQSPPTAGAELSQQNDSVGESTAVSEVSASLRAPQEFAVDQVPHLIADIDNHGTQTFHFSPRQPRHQLEIDGVWYRWTAKIRVLSTTFPPGASHHGIEFFLDPRTWGEVNSPLDDVEQGKPLKLTPGVHSVRVGFTLNPPDRVGPASRVVTNKVELVIKPKSPAKEEVERSAPPHQTSRIYSVDVSGTGLSLIADENAFDGRTFLGSASWSPDGSAVLFDATKDLQFAETRLVKKTLSGPKANSVKDLGFGLGPRVSPDGKRIACYMNGRNPDGLTSGIYMMNSDGSDRKRLSWGSLPRWSPDGKTILAVGSFRAPRKYILVDVETGRVKQILKNQTCLGVPCWSPDGRRIAGTVLDGEDRILCIFEPQVEPDSRIELWRDHWHEGYEETIPAWSPDGNTIAFTHNANTGVELLLLKPSPGSKPESLAIVPFGISIRDCVWSPDGKRIIFAGIGDELLALSTTVAK